MLLSVHALFQDSTSITSLFFCGKTIRITVVFTQRDQQGILLQNCEQNCLFCMETIYLPTVGTKILH